MTPLKSFDGVSRALTSLLMSAPASSSIWTMASSPRTQAYMRGVIPCGRKVQAGLIIAAPDVLFKRGKKGDDLFRGVFCNQTEQLEIVRGEEEKGQHAAEGRGAGVKPRPLPMNQLWYLMYFLFGRKKPFIQQPFSSTESQASRARKL